jgi:hypothetical protein
VVATATKLVLNEKQEAALDRAFKQWSFSDSEKAVFLVQLASLDWEEQEVVLCAADPEYFITVYCKIYDAQALDWIPFELWAEQLDALWLLHFNQLLIALKARQLGLSWLALAYGLWQLLFAPIATILIFSKRDDEATYLLGEERLRGIYNHLPDFLKAESVIEDNVGTWKLSNGSVARAFPTTAGDSYTATLVIVDEADLVPNLNKMLRSIKPTIDAGGKMLMISRSNKNEPQSEFKQIYRGAKKGTNGWACIFLPWWVRPERSQAWYEGVKSDILERTGALDDLHEQYPSTDDEALAPAQKNKRVPAAWVDKCKVSMKPLKAEAHPELAEILRRVPGLVVYRLPERGKKYAGGLDCAEGLPSSDDSASTWINAETGEEVANLVGKYPPAEHAMLSAIVSRFYNDAGLMVENNNHGHASILWLNDNRDPNDNFPYQKLVLQGHNKKDGWTSNTLGKLLMYEALSEVFRLEETIIHDEDTAIQIKSVEKSTLRAPEGELEDRADSYAFAVLGAQEVLKREENSWDNVYSKMRGVKTKHG